MQQRCLENPLHEGPIMEKRDGLKRHCELPLPNHTCPYLSLGCKGCTLSTAIKLPINWRSMITENLVLHITITKSY